MPKASELKCFFGCDVNGPLHRFPKWEYPHTEKFDQWKSVLDSATQERGNNYIYNSVRICYQHFEDYFNLPSGRLTKNAVPTLNLDNSAAIIFEELETLGPGELQFHNPEDKHNLRTLRRQGDCELEGYILKRNAWLNAGPDPEPKPCGSTNNVEPSTVISQETTGDKDIPPSPPCSLADSREGIHEIVPEEEIARVSGIKRKKIISQGRQILVAKEKLKKIIPTKRPRNYAKKQNFDKITKKLNPLARKIIWMQISQCNKKGNGYRFTDEEKAIGLSIWKQSPEAYKFLRSIFILPSMRTMARVKRKLEVETEKNQHILQTKQTVVENEQSQENIDEVFLELGL